MEYRAIPFQKAVITPYKVLNPPLATTGDRGLGEVVSRMVDWPRELCLAQGAVVDPGGACDHPPVCEHSFQFAESLWGTLNHSSSLKQNKLLAYLQVTQDVSLPGNEEHFITWLASYRLGA